MLNNIKEKMANTKGKLTTASIVVASMVSGSANAALTPEAEAAFTSLKEAAADNIGMAWSIAPIVVVGFIGIKLFQRAANKAT